MSEENKELETLKAEMAKKNEEFANQKAELDKLKKIFDERQTKALKKEDVLKKDEILKALGFGADDKVDPIEALKKVVLGTQEKVENLTKELEKEREASTKVVKKAEAERVAKELGFIDPEDALVGIDLSGDIEKQIKERAEKKPHLLKKDDVGGNFSGHSGKSTKDEEVAEALKKLGIL